MLKSKELLVVTSIVSLLAFPFVVSAATLTASCAGAPSTTSIAWSATSTGGVAPVAFLWGNGSTSTTQTIAVTPGTYSMALQVTDASSTVATTTCSATVAAPVPVPPGPTLAEQIAAVLNQIAALKTQLAQLLAQQANSNTGNATSTPAGCFNFGHDLEEGDEGDDVRNLQKTLASDSTVFPAGLITGFFGRLTHEAVKKFQEKHGITATGYFGPKSRGFFESQCSSSGDSDHDRVPDSIDDDNEDSSDDRSSATSTVNSGSTTVSPQGNSDRSNDSSRENRNRGSDDNSNDD